MSDSVDILMAVYNGKKYIKEQIESILHQSYPHFRLIIRDDDSNDSTHEIIQEYALNYPEKIILIPKGEKLGVIGNFSHLMSVSQAKYIMFCDQDDVWIEDKIEKTHAKIKELEIKFGQHCPLLVHTDLKVVDEKLNVLHNSFWKCTHLMPHNSHIINKLVVQNVVTGCTVLFNRPLLELALPIPKEALMHDWWLALVAAAMGQIDCIKEPLILYRQHNSNTLGAKKFGSLVWFKEGFKKLVAVKKVYSALNNQAQIFLKRYEHLLSANQIRLMEDFCYIKDQTWIKGRFVILKYGFFKQGFFRSIISFFLH